MLNLKQTKWIIFDKDLRNVWDKDCWLPVEELTNLNKQIKYYRGWKAAINAYISGRGTVSAIRNNEIRVLPIELSIKVDDSYKEVPVSTYFYSKYNVDINHLCRYIKTEKFNVIIDSKEVVKIEFGRTSERGQDNIYVVWTEKDKYGINRDYSDTVIATSDNKEDLI